MTPDQKRKRLLQIAEARLRDYPGAFSRFLLTYLRSVRASDRWYWGEIAPFTPIAEVLDPAEKLREFDRKAVAFIDAWATKEIPLPPPPPPLLPPPQVDLPPPIEPLYLIAQPPPVVAVTPAKPKKQQRRDLLTPLIEQAQADAPDPFDTAVIWLKLREYAQQKIHPLFGVTEDGLQWTNSSDEVETLNRQALVERLRRAQKLQR